MLDLLKDKTLKAKEKVTVLSGMIRSKEISVKDLIPATNGLKEADITVVMESLEYVTRDDKQFALQEVFDFAVKHIEAANPSLKRESARVVGNTVSISMRNVDKALSRLLVNTEDPGTVVRWSSAYAIGEIYKLNLHELPHLGNTLQAILQREQKNSIRKIYEDAIKKSQKK